MKNILTQICASNNNSYLIKPTTAKFMWFSWFTYWSVISYCFLRHFRKQFTNRPYNPLMGPFSQKNIKKVHIVKSTIQMFFLNIFCCRHRRHQTYNVLLLKPLITKQPNKENCILKV